jgi:hypothetical protein
MGARVFSPGVKCGQSMTLTAYSHLVPGSRMSRRYTSVPIIICMVVVGQLYFSVSLMYKTNVSHSVIERWVVGSKENVYVY